MAERKHRYAVDDSYHGQQHGAHRTHNRMQDGHLASLVHLRVNDVLGLVGAGTSTESEEDWDHLSREACGQLLCDVQCLPCNTKDWLHLTVRMRGCMIPQCKHIGDNQWMETQNHTYVGDRQHRAL